MKQHSVFVRLFGAALALGPITVLVYHLWRHAGDKHGGFSTPIILLLLICIFSVPGGYLAIVGAKPTPPEGFRSQCIFQIVAGFVMIALWLLVMVIGNYFTWLMGFIFIWHGLLAIAAITISSGFLSLISNRELLHEMSELNLWGKQDADS